MVCEHEYMNNSPPPPIMDLSGFFLSGLASVTGALGGGGGYEREKLRTGEASTGIKWEWGFWEGGESPL